MSESKNRLAKLYLEMTREEEERKRAEKEALLKPFVNALDLAMSTASVAHTMLTKTKRARKHGGLNKTGKFGPIREAVNKIVKETGDRSLRSVVEALQAETYLGMDTDRGGGLRIDFDDLSTKLDYTDRRGHAKSISLRAIKDYAQKAPTK